MSLRKIFYHLPPAWRFLARRLYYWPVDLLDGLAGRRDELTPPRGLIYTGGGDFRAQGLKMLGYFINDGGLQPFHQVLDVGSGIGRIAVALTTFLDERGAYEGFDVVRTGVDWCRKHISSRFPRFRFTYIPLDNDLYRSGGESPADFRFPYADQSFDFIVVISVFTHMLPPEVGNYLQEISRVLRPGGTCFATFFLWNEESAGLSAQNRTFSFPYERGHYRLMDEKVRSANVAFDEDHLTRHLIRPTGLQVEKTHYGYWCGRDKSRCRDFQDILVLRRDA